MRILLIDDHAIVRAGFRRILADEIEGLVIGEASDGREAMDEIRRAPWDLVVLDLSLPGRGGLEVLAEIRETRRAPPVLVMTMYSEDQYALRAFRAGAAGYITKGCGPEEILQAVRKVCSGGRYLTPALAEKLAASLSVDAGRLPHEALSDRELQVLRMLAAGKAVKAIGGELFLSEKTVSTYRARILKKLCLKTSAELMRYALQARLVD